MAHVDLVCEFYHSHVDFEGSPSGESKACSASASILRCILEDLVQAGIQIAFTCAMQFNTQVIGSIVLSAMCSIGGMTLAIYNCYS